MGKSRLRFKGFQLLAIVALVVLPIISACTHKKEAHRVSEWVKASRY